MVMMDWAIEHGLCGGATHEVQRRLCRWFGQLGAQINLGDAVVVGCPILCQFRFA